MNPLLSRGFYRSQTRNFGLGDAQASDAAPAPDTVTLAQVTCPSDTPDGLHAPGLRFGDSRVMALMAATVGFTHLIAGFDNPALTERVAALLGQPYTSRQATYDLRRLKRKGTIEHAGSTRRYRLSAHGRRVAVLFTKAHSRILAPGLVQLDPNLPVDIARRSPLAQAWRKLDRVLDDYIDHQLIAAGT